jgi:hypothetical protein
MLVNKKKTGRDALRLVWGTGGTGDILVGEKDSVSTRKGVGTRRGARRLSSVDHHQTLYWLRFFFCFRTWLGGRHDQAVYHCRIRVRNTPGLLEGCRSCSVKKSLLE